MNLSMIWRRQTIGRFLGLVLLTIGLVVLSASISSAQLLPTVNGSPSAGTAAPIGVERLGNIESAKVSSPVDGRYILTVSSPTVLNRNEPGDLLPVEYRADQVEAQILRVLRLDPLPKPEAIQVEQGILSQQIVLFANAPDEFISRPLPLVTVTDLDGLADGRTPEEVAADWQGDLQYALEQDLALVSPERYNQQLIKAFQVIGGAIVITIAIWFANRILRKRKQHLQSRQKVALEAAQAAAAQVEHNPEQPLQTVQNRRNRLVDLVLQQFSIDRRLQIDNFFLWLLLWLQILIWYGAALWVMAIIPYWMKWRVWLLSQPLIILSIWFFITLALWIARVLIDKLLNAWREGRVMANAFGDEQRRMLRIGTTGNALKGLVVVIFYAIGIVWTLDSLGVPTGSVLAGSAIIGLAISFGSQNVVRDLVNGTLILLEDQYAVGDVITVDAEGGLVENLNLRVTQLRSGDGELITIPNSAITKVKNLTRTWSRVNFSIDVAYKTDPQKALDLLTEIAQGMYDEPEWRDRMPEEPQVLGVDSVTHAGMTLRVWIKTVPMQQWAVGREFRLRVRKAFEAHGIEIGMPQRITHADFEVNGESDSGASSVQPSFPVS